MIEGSLCGSVQQVVWLCMVARDTSARVGGVLGHLRVVVFLFLHAVLIACGAHTCLHAPVYYVVDGRAC